MELIAGIEQIENFKKLYSWWKTITPNTKERISKRTEVQKDKDRFYIRATNDQISFITTNFYRWFVSTTIKNEIDISGIFSFDFQMLRDKKVNPKKIIGIRFDFAKLKIFITEMKNKTKHSVLDFSLEEVILSKKQAFVFNRIREMENTEIKKEATLMFDDFTYGFCRLFGIFDFFVFKKENTKILLNVKNNELEFEGEFVNSYIKENTLKLRQENISFYSFFGGKVEVSKGKCESKTEEGESYYTDFLMGEVAGLRHYSLC